MGTPALQGLLLLPLLLRPPRWASAGSLHSPGESGKVAWPKSLLYSFLGVCAQGWDPKTGEVEVQVGGSAEQP